MHHHEFHVKDGFVACFDFRHQFINRRGRSDEFYWLNEHFSLLGHKLSVDAKLLATKLHQKVDKLILFIGESVS